MSVSFFIYADDGGEFFDYFVPIGNGFVVRNVRFRIIVAKVGFYDDAGKALVGNVIDKNVFA